MDELELNKLLKSYKKEDLFVSEQIKREELVSFTFHSTSIEGSSLTYEEVYSLLNDNIGAPKSMVDNLMNIDHAKAYEFALNEFRKLWGLSEDFIRKVNSVVMKNTGKVVNTALGNYDESRGEFRLTSVSVGTRYFPDHKKVKQLIAGLCDSFNKKIKNKKTGLDILNIASDLHFDFVSIHPFSDGNGRTARILMNAVLFGFDMPRLILQSENKKEYYEALEQTRNMGDKNIFRSFIYSQYVNQLNREIINYRKAKANKTFLTL